MAPPENQMANGTDSIPWAVAGGIPAIQNGLPTDKGRDASRGNVLECAGRKKKITKEL